MSWLRLDDKMPSHPKLLRLTRAQRWTWLEILCYCAEYHTQGLIPPKIRIALPHATEKFINRLKTLGLIDENEDGTRFVHDFDQYNSREAIERERERVKKQRQRLRVDSVPPSVPPAEGDTNGTEVGTRAQARARSRPDPFREGGSGSTPADSAKGSAAGRPLRDDEKRDYKPESGEALVRNGWWADPHLDAALRGYFADIPDAEVDRLCTVAGELAEGATP